MITLTAKTDCCGCNACAAICPARCIHMQADEEGFLYPHVHTERCINCGRCEKVCPVLHRPAPVQQPLAYAAKHKDKSVRLHSSSGGVFSALAEQIFAEGGAVFGAAFRDDWSVGQQAADTKDNLDKLLRSKYVQSEMGSAYEEVKIRLEAGRAVLFAGTPCQIAGLKNYLGRDYPHLFTAALICHAVPSPAVWQLFLKQQFISRRILAVNFKDKTFSWACSYLSFQTDKGPRVHGDRKTIAERIIRNKMFTKIAPFVYQNLFLKAFLKELINRPICHECPFKNGRHGADFTLGDLWGKWPEGILNPADKRAGMSALLVSSEKGKALLEKNRSLELKPVSLKQIEKFNARLLCSPKPHPRRQEFFARYHREPLRRLIPALLQEKPWPLRLLAEAANSVYRRVYGNKKDGKHLPLD